MPSLRRLVSSLGLLALLPALLLGARQVEKLDRGLVALPVSPTSVFLSWRLLGDEARDTAFNLYRSQAGGDPVKLNSAPLTSGTCFTDETASTTAVSEYWIRTVVENSEGPESRRTRVAAGAQVLPYLSLPLSVPAGLTMPDGSTCTYSPNDCSVGDLDGDGSYEVIVKWDPSNSKDNSQSGYTGNVYLDAYTLSGRQLWRIDLGRNIRAGAHYTQFMVYDLDGDGRAEVACRTADGAVDGTGKVIGDSAADHRNTSGYILGGPEFLSVFAGATGAELARLDYAPTRVPSGALFPAKSEIKSVWGDDYGNRIDRFLACVAYLDGSRPSLVMCRGYYTRTVLVAYDFRGGSLVKRWTFDTTDGVHGAYAGQGNHNLSVADVDGDGRDEIIYGACTINDDGKGLYNTNLHHGDALHVTDLIPSRPGLEVWGCHEDYNGNGNIGLSLRDAATGERLFTVSASKDIGRACAGDIDPRYPGMEIWGATGSLYSANGTVISSTKPAMNFMAWWDGDLSREILNDISVTKWNSSNNTISTLLTATGCASNNTTKATPNLSADILGDWREEIILRAATNDELRIYTTTIPTVHRIPALMHDPHYRTSIAWQNVAYNQPPHTSFFLGTDMTTVPASAITTSIDTSDARIVNLSGRARTGKDEETMVVGYYTQDGEIRTLVRAVGPGLEPYMVPGFATDPRLDFFAGLNFVEANDNWGAHATPADLAALMDRTGAFALPASSKDAALMPLIAPGGYTAEARNQGEDEGVALVEIYADTQTTAGKLINVSARAYCGDAFQRLVAGFSIKGNSPRRVLIRAIGPGLKPYGITRFMKDPYIELYRSGKLIDTNEDWAQSQATAATFTSVGAFELPADSKDAAILVTLLPGLYTAEVFSKTGEGGVALAEVYDVD